MHRDDIFPPEKTAADDPVAFCVAGRWAGIDEMVAGATVDTARIYCHRIVLAHK